ncbi:MAG: fibronectin type III domain-containing protein [Methanophagales archaeon]|nr:fibronectin type III domain-containing protein [Methanophagales archaeon]
MKKRQISIAISIVVFAALFGLIAPVQAGMYTVQGYVYDTNGVTPVDGVDVTVTDTTTGDSLSYTTKWGGFYSVVFGWPATADVTAGDTLEIVATYGTLTNTTAVVATGVSPQIVDLILQAEPPYFVTYTISNYVITPSAPITVIDVEFSEEVEAWIKIEDSDRNLVNELYYDSDVTNPTPKTWNGTNTTGVQVPDGDYYVNVTGTSTATGLSVVNNSEIITVDRTAPAISNVASSDITRNSATITWTTDEDSDSLVKYGTTSGTYPYTKYDASDVTSHSIGLTGLAASTTYYFIVNSTDQSGNSNESIEHSFTTLAAPAIIPANVVIKPETLNLKSKGKFTVFITLPEGYNVVDIDIGTVVCEGAPAVKGMVADDNKYIAKFNIQDLVGVEPGDAVTLTVTGKLFDGTLFEGSDTIRVIEKGKGGKK